MTQLRLPIVILRRASRTARRTARAALPRALAALLSASLAFPAGLATAWAADDGAQPSRTELQGLQVDADQVTLKLSGAAKYNTFVTANPPRLVLELLNTEATLSTRSLPGKGQYLKRVRSGQFTGDPNPVARVVLDLAKAVNYRVSGSGSSLLVRLEDDAAAAQSAPAAVAAKPASAPPAAAPAPAPTPDAVVAAARKVASTAPKPEPADSQPQPFSTEASPELMQTGMSHRSQAIPLDSTGAPAIYSSGTRGRRDILATLPRDPISLDLDDADVRDALKMLGARANINLVYGPEVGGTMSVHLDKVPFAEAFNIALSMNKLVASQVGDNILEITTLAALKDARSKAIELTRVFPVYYADAKDLKMALDQTRTAEGRVGSSVVDAKSNSLVVTETPEGLEAAERLINQLDTRPRQVLIEAKLVEVKLSKDLDLGIQWDAFGMENGKALGKQGITTIGSPIGPTATPTVGPLDQQAQSQPGFAGSGNNVGAAGRGTGVLLPADKVFGAMTLGRITNNYILSATLTAAASQGKAKVLSDPKIATLNGKQANINITTQTPYVTSSVTPTGVISNNVNYITTGIQLAVKPTINADGRVTLEIKPTVSQPSASVTVAGASGAPAVDSRNADTNVIVQDGETIVIGGLITDSVQDTIQKVPLLGDIPILGWLFKKKSVSRSRVELLIFVTPRIMPD